MEESSPEETALQPPEYEKASMITVVSIILLFIVFWALSGLAGIITAVVTMIGILALPLIVWNGGAYIIGWPFFRWFFVRRGHESFLRRWFHVDSHNSAYFLVSPKFPKSITWRFAQTDSVFFLFASTIAYLIPSSRDPVAENGPSCLQDLQHFTL